MDAVVCVIAVVVDLWKGLKTRQYWIPSKCSSLNAASITVITAASKLLLDVSTSMPHQIDQLSKVSTSAFVCIALANVASSVGKLEHGEFPANIAALSIFVISSIVGLCIQLTNGVIFTFRIAHITMAAVMGILLVECFLSVAFISVFKSVVKVKYDTRHQKALDDVKNRKHLTIEKLKQYLERLSMMAHSVCPHFLMAQTLASFTYALYGSVAAIAFFTSLIACITHKNKFLDPTSRSGTSNYGWSVLYILISQTIGVGVGTVVLCIRWYNYFQTHSRKRDPNRSFRERSTSAAIKYWMRFSVYPAKVLPLLPYIEFKQQKCPGYMIYWFNMASLFFKFMLGTINGVLLQPALAFIWKYILEVMRVPPHRDEDDPERIRELKPYFLVSENFVHIQTEWIMKSISFVTETHLGAGERTTKHLTKLLKEYCSDGFEGVAKFRIPSIPPISQESPPSCWALSVLTLTYIATALPNINHKSMVELRKSVTEGLVYVKFIEDSFNNKHDFANFWFNASLLWLKLDVTDMTRFIFDLKWVPNKDCFGDKTAKETLESIKGYARSLFMPLRFPVRSVGAHYMYGTCEMILRDCANDLDDSSLIFDKLRRTISDILGACLINLKSYILVECEASSSSIEKMREAACEILKLYGETEDIMKFLEKRQVPNIPPEKMVHMDSWYESHHHHERETEASDYSCSL